LPLLTYVIERLNPSKKTLGKLKVYWNTAFRKIFLYKPWEPVNGLIDALGRVNLEFTYYQRKVCFLNNMLNSDNCFVYRIMALFCTQMSTNYYVSRQGSSHMVVTIESSVISVKSFTMHMFCSFCCCRMFDVCLYIVVSIASAMVA